MHASLRHAGRTVVDFALPPRCPACGIIVPDPHVFCVACWQQLTFLGDPACARCGLPFEYDAGDASECGACLADPPDFDRLRAAVAYGDIARQVTLKLKYSGRPGVAETLARLMRRHAAALPPGTVIAPVPLHRWRIWRRGYNQAGLLARVLAARTGLPLDLDLLRRVKSTPSMRGKSRRERALTVRGAFRVEPAAKARLAGRPVLLIDDVYTTGATANDCARALRKAGASHVDILCWARVLKAGD